MVLWISISIFIILSILLFIMDTVQTRGEERITSDDKIPKDINVILVLGAGLEYNGSLCDMLEDRLKKADNLSKNIKNAKFLLSGQYSKLSYNEIYEMKKYIMSIDKNIKEEDIFLDCASFSTYESIYRAKNMFKVSEMIIVTNYYHLPRALYIAEKLGIRAFGIFSDSREYINIERYREKELLAQVKDFIYTNILKSKPKILKDELSIKIYSGRNRNNKIKN